jgi:hypothetical protein
MTLPCPLPLRACALALPGALTAAFALGGCAPLAAQPALGAAPECSAGADCEAKWRAARTWVRADAGLPIYRSDERHIETYNGWPAQDPRLVVRVTREPLAEGRYRIQIEADCAYDLGCLPDRRLAIADFNRSVAAASASTAQP